MSARGKLITASAKLRFRVGPLLLLLFALAIAASPADAAVAVDNVTTSQIPSTSPNPFTFSHSTSGSDRLLLVSIASQPNDDDGIVEVVTGITYDGTPIPTGTTIPSGVGFKFLLYINNHGSAVSDVSVRDVLDPAFEYQAATIQVDNSVGECAQISCTAIEEAAIFSAVNGAATQSDAVDGDVASYTGASSSVDAGNENVSNLQLNISANTVWAMLFTVKML